MLSVHLTEFVLWSWFLLHPFLLTIPYHSVCIAAFLIYIRKACNNISTDVKLQSGSFPHILSASSSWGLDEDVWFVIL